MLADLTRHASSTILSRTQNHSQLCDSQGMSLFVEARMPNEGPPSELCAGGSGSAGKSPEFVSILQPIFIFFKLFGIDVKWGAAHSASSRCYCFIWFLINIATVIYTAKMFYHLYIIGDPTFNRMFNFSFAFIAASVQIVGTHASFVLADRRHGTQLAESFTKLEILFPIDKKTLEQVRSVTVAAVVITIFLACAFASIVTACFSAPLPIDNAMFFLWHILLNIYLPLPAFFFCILSWTLAKLFGRICKQMDAVFAQDAAAHDIGHLIKVWAEQHSLISQAIYQLEKYFQNIMMVHISCIFVGTISYCVFILLGIAQFNFKTSIFCEAVLIRFVVLNAVCYAAERLKNQAVNIQMCLLKSNLLQARNEAEQVMRLMAQIYLVRPKLTIGGYFEINRRLVPLLIGTTITNVLLLISYAK